jgi:hypothetical protein
MTRQPGIRATYPLCTRRLRFRGRRQHSQREPGGEQCTGVPVALPAIADPAVVGVPHRDGPAAAQADLPDKRKAEAAPADLAAPAGFVRLGGLGGEPAKA